MRHQLALLIATCLALGSLVSAQKKKDFYDPDTVRDIYLTFSQNDFLKKLHWNKRSAPKGTLMKATMQVDGVTYKDVGVRVRGLSSYWWLPSNHPKVSLNIDTDAYVPDQELLGYDNINLNNGFHDPTFMREFITYMISRRYGPAPKCNFVRVWLNKEYWGIYINVQQPDKAMMKEWFKNKEGNRYRGMSAKPFTKAALTWLGKPISNYFPHYQFKKGDGTDLRKLIDIFNHTPKNKIQTELPKVWNVDRSFWYFACMNIVGHEDCYIGTGKDHSHYHDPLHGQFNIMPFDVNESFDADGRFGPRWDVFINSTSSEHPALSKTLQFGDWKARYLAHYRTVWDESFSWPKIGALIAKYQKLIAADVARDTKKLFPTKSFVDGVTKSVSGDIGQARATVPGLKPFIEARVKYLRGVADLNRSQPTLSGLQRSPGTPRATDTVWITARVSNSESVTLYSRVKGPFGATSMHDDGKHHDGAANDGVFGAAIPPHAAGTQVDYYVGATTKEGVMRFLPRSAEFRAPHYVTAFPSTSSPVRISEFMAKNNRTIKDEKGQFEDWVELVNVSQQTVSISGMYLTDDQTKPTKWKIPANQSIAPNGRVLIWLDEDASDGPLHANFKLSADGESLHLFAADGKTVLDGKIFGPQLADVATARIFDASPLWVTTADSTPRAGNDVGAAGLARRYSAMDPTRQRLQLTVSGSTKLGSSVKINLSGGTGQSLVGLFVSGAPSHVDVRNPGPVALLNPGILVTRMVLSLDLQGKMVAPLRIPNMPVAIGRSVFVQAFVSGLTGFDGSNAAQVKFRK